MPTYDYKCKNCSHEFEQFQSMKDAALRKCPNCGKNTLERLIGTGAAILFKGSGFYQTDYRSESYKASHKAETAAATGNSAEGSAGAKSDAGKSEPAKSGDAAAAKTEAPKPAESKPKPHQPTSRKKQK